MKKLPLLIAAMVSPLVFSACGDEDHKKTSGFLDTHSYEYEVNGCNTGKHEYTTRASFCMMLADDELNHGCAPELRQQAIEQYCSGAQNAESSEPSVEPAAEPPTEALEETFAPQAGSPHGFNPYLNNQGYPGYNGQHSAAIAILGKLAPNPTLKTSEASGSVITTLDGAFHASREMSQNFSIELSYAGSAEFSSMTAHCILSVRNFTTIHAGQSLVHFTLVGIDPKENVSSPTSCASTLRAYARSGFRARFKGAYLMGGAVSGPVASVELSVY